MDSTVLNFVSLLSSSATPYDGNNGFFGRKTNKGLLIAIDRLASLEYPFKNVMAESTIFFAELTSLDRSEPEDKSKQVKQE